MGDSRSPVNTTKQVQDAPELMLAEMMGQGSSAAIESQEAAGQREILFSDVIPSKGPVPELEKLGFEIGPMADASKGDDPLFRSCKLPKGWSREGTDHSMHSSIVDEMGRRRVCVFYKAAFHDRRADFHIEQTPTTAAQREAAEAFEREVYGDDFLSWDRRRELEGEVLVVTLSERAKDANGNKILRPEAEGGGYEKSGRIEARRFALDGSET
jgi:hypothetical protein